MEGGLAGVSITLRLPEVFPHIYVKQRSALEVVALEVQGQKSNEFQFQFRL
jgi:hypothetical protein